MTDDTLLPVDLPSVQRKKVSAAFDGGLISSDGGLVLLREAERSLRLAETLAGCIRDRRNQAQVVHALSAMLRFRMLAIACGYEDADGCDALRTDPVFKLASGKAPQSGRALCSQPTMSRLENTPSRTEVARMTAALVDIFCRSFPAPPATITLDIDDTCDAVHGHQQLSLFHAHYGTRCFLPVHVYHVESGKSVAGLLRPGKTPSGPEVHTLIKHLVRGIRRHGPAPGSSSGETVTTAARKPWPGVRRTASTIHLRACGQSRPARACIRGGRRPQGASRRGRRREDAQLRRLRLCRPLLGPRTPGRRPTGGEHPRLRRPLCRHLARRRAPPSLRRRLSLCGSGHPEGAGPHTLPVGVVDHAVGPPLPEGHVEGIEHEPRAQVVGHGPAHHAAAEGIQHDGEEQEPGPGRDVGDVRDPEPVGCVGAEVALDQVRRRTGARIPCRRPRSLAPADAPQAGTAHQSGDALAAHSAALSDELGMDAGCALGALRDAMDLADAIEQRLIALGAG